MQTPIEHFLSRHYKSVLPTKDFIKNIGSVSEDLDCDCLLNSTNLVSEDFSNPYGLISLLNIKKIRINATNAGLDSIIMGLMWGGNDINKLGIFGELIKTAPTARRAIQYFLKYAKRIEYMPFAMKSVEENQMFRLYFPFKLHESKACLQTAESVFLKKWSVMFNALGILDTDTLTFTVTHSRPDDMEVYERSGVHNIQFNQAKLGLHISSKFLDRVNPQRNDKRHREAQHLCQYYLEEKPIISSSTNILQKISYFIIDRIKPESPWGESVSTLTEAAAHFHKSESTLRRELQQHDTSFKKCIEELKSYLAQAYLKYTHFSVSEVAYKMGYSDTANFRRAFKKWVNTTPDDFRRQHSVWNNSNRHKSAG